MLAVAEPVRGAGVDTVCRETQAKVVFNRRRIFVVDNDHLYREIATDALLEDGFEVFGFATADDMLSRMRGDAHPDVIVVDWGVNGAGLDVLSAVHAVEESLPVVFVTSQTSPILERLAFQRGAVDFIDKSRGTNILAKRLDLIVANKRRPVPSKALLQRGPLIADLTSARAYWKGTDAGLTVGEFKVLHLLASRTGHVSYRELYDAMHYSGFVAGQGAEGFRGNVRTSIKRLRKKFCQCDPTFNEITNYSGFGYVWGQCRA